MVNVPISLKVESLDACNRCGKCCFYVKEGKVTKCHNLIEWNDGKTTCAIWNDPKRVGSIIDYVDGEPLRCSLIAYSKVNYKGCPYNAPGRPEAPW